MNTEVYHIYIYIQFKYTLFSVTCTKWMCALPAEFLFIQKYLFKNYYNTYNANNMRIPVQHFNILSYKNFKYYFKHIHTNEGSLQAPSNLKFYNQI